jgi:DNA-binding Lrp family transcriptional regulator
VLALAEQDIPQRAIARMLNISQATVTRRIKEALEARRERRRAILINAMLVYLTVLATVVAAAIASLAW